MKTFAAILFAALTTVSTVAHAAPDATLCQLRTYVTARFDISQPATLKGYVPVALQGWTGPAFRLADNVSRTDMNQPATLMFDGASRLVAVGFSRPSSSGVDVIELESLSFWHMDVAPAVASR